MKSPKLLKPEIYCCPVENCRKSKMASINAVNVHLAKKHEVNYKIVENPKGSPIVRMT